MNTATQAATNIFNYSRWRHGGWYVHDVRYPSGAIGCVSRNYNDRKWRIACDPRGFDAAPTFKNRDAAAQAEYAIVQKAQEYVAAGMSAEDAEKKAYLG